MELNKTSALFITEKKYVDFTIPGGVQLCTEEFIQYFEKAGYALTVFKVQPVVTVLKRIKIKLGIEIYSLYEVEKYLEELCTLIVAGNIKTVLFNQLNLAHWTAALKPRLPDDVRFIGLSHGNESGDFLHDITKISNGNGGYGKGNGKGNTAGTSKSDNLGATKSINLGATKTTALQTWRLGKLLVREKYLFQQLLDGVITISKHESYIDQWLGARKILYLPRILKPDWIRWTPGLNRIGFVGTLNHLPNLQGIVDIAEELTAKHFKGQLRLVGSPPQTGLDLAKKYPFIFYAGALTETELRDEASHWSLFLNPVFWYSRGSSTKLAQGLNWGIPVLSTPAGSRGYSLSDLSILCEDNTAHSFVKAVFRILGAAPIQDSAIALTQSLLAAKQATVNNLNAFDIEPWLLQLQQFIDDKKPGNDA